MDEYTSPRTAESIVKKEISANIIWSFIWPHTCVPQCLLNAFCFNILWFLSFIDVKEIVKVLLSAGLIMDWNKLKYRQFFSLKGARGGSDMKKCIGSTWMQKLICCIVLFEFSKIFSTSRVIRKLPIPVWKIRDMNPGNMAASNAYSTTKNLKHNRQPIVS